MFISENKKIRIEQSDNDWGVYECTQKRKTTEWTFIQSCVDQYDALNKALELCDVRGYEVLLSNKM